MSEDLLGFYNSELSYLRQLGQEFADLHPKIASRLGIQEADTWADPHSERLVEAFAFLTARIRHKLDDDFPELAESLLNVLYPHYLTPIPSAAIVEMQLDPGQGGLASGHTIPLHNGVETEAIEGEPLRFRTCYPTTLWPLRMSTVEFRGMPFSMPQIARSGSNVESVLHLQLDSFSPDLPVQAMPIDRLRFFLKGASTVTFPLYELMLNHCLHVVIGNSPNDPDAIRLPASSLQPVGFAEDQGLIDYPQRSQLGYRLLSEYFAFPEKFLFVDLMLPQGSLRNIGQNLQIYIVLNRYEPPLERDVSLDTVRLGCTPIINLFQWRAQTIPLTHLDYEYRINYDSGRALSHEIFSIESVTATSPEKEVVTLQPFFSVRHVESSSQSNMYWHATRRPAVKGGDQPDAGTEMYLSIVDVDFQPDAPQGWFVDVQTICSNRDLPERLPFGGGQPHLQLEGKGPVSKVTCLTRPTPTRRQRLRMGTRWRLLSHLSLNHLSLTDLETGADGLREILELYNMSESPATAAQIEGLKSIECRPAIARTGQSVASGFARGTEVTMLFDESKYSGTGVFLFASVLRQFLGLYASINSFVRVIARTQQREGELKRWPPLAGSTSLL